jgi:hypothetical protein
MGFRAWWRWKSHNPGGRPAIDQEVRDLVRRMGVGLNTMPAKKILCEVL